jgi:DNA helicase IV
MGVEAEQAHLDRTCDAYDAALAALTRERTGGVDEFAGEALELMRRERIRQYTAASGPLYFGRIDSVDGTARYVGRHAVWGPDNQLLAINWRAPAAEPFYSATPADPHGLRRRRRLDIVERRVLGYVDEALAAGEDHLTEAIVDDITRQRLGEMRQIISTITPDQYELISEPADGALVIQGGPGTGKTAVGLHRAAWLLYADRDLARVGVLVVGPNPTFIRYIAQVLPSLGEHSVEQRPIEALVSGPRREEPEPRAIAALKSSARMAVVLERALWDRLRVDDREYAIPVGRRAVTVTPADVRALVLAARERTRSYGAGRERFRQRLAALVAARASEHGHGSLVASDEVLVAVRKAREYQACANRVWPRETPEGLCRRAFRNRARLKELAGDLLDAAEIDLLVGAPPADKRRDMTATDVALLDEARWLVEPDLRRYGHVVVDEAQNLTAMELRMAVRRARGHSLTILGDLAQRTADDGAPAWDAVLLAVGVERHLVRELPVSYRVPDDFLRVASAVVPPGQRVPRGVRAAAAPPLVVAAADGGLSAASAEVAARLAREVGSVGVVVPRACADAIRAALAPLEYADGTAGALGAGVNLVDLHVMKGLEFDAVVVVEPAAILAERPDGGRGGLYTALTRPTRALAVVHAEPLPDPLAVALRDGADG